MSPKASNDGGCTIGMSFVVRIVGQRSCSRARADVLQRAGAHARDGPGSLSYRSYIVFRQPERIPAADEEGIDAVEIARALQLDDVDLHPREFAP